jgi:hypothetical protein
MLKAFWCIALFFAGVVFVANAPALFSINTSYEPQAWKAVLALMFGFVLSLALTIGVDDE